MMAASHVWTTLCSESFSTSSLDQIVLDQRCSDTTSNLREWGAVFCRTTRHMFRLNGQSSDFIAFAGATWKTFDDYLVALSQQICVMLNKGLMGSKDFESLATCALHEEFPTSIKPFSFHDMHKYGVGHFTVSYSILKFGKEKENANASDVNVSISCALFISS